jgi:DNA-directed RNA polymerase specialized sigma24 family protein
MQWQSIMLRSHNVLTYPSRHRMKDWELTEESLNLFLSWLANDRDAAGRKYEDIRRRLLIILECRNCMQAEDVVDEAMNRFIRRLPELIKTYKGDPFPYILVIARNVQSEKDKKQMLPLPEHIDLPAEPVETDEVKELVHDCLDKCLGELDPKNRNLLMDYYQNNRQDKIDFRKNLAKQLGIAANALRLRVHRIRATVHSCMNDCLGTDLPFEMK